MSRLWPCASGGKARRCPAMLALIAVALAVPPLAAAERGDLSTDEVLANVRRAIGVVSASSHEQDILMTGRGEQLGLTGESTLRFSPNGRFAMRFHGRIDMQAAYDGHRGWVIDYRGIPRPLELEELELAQTEAWMLSGHWLSENAPFAISRVPEMDGEHGLALSLERRDGHLRAYVHVDPTTWFPRAMQRDSWLGHETWEFGDYREFAGMRLPTRVTYESDNGNVRRDQFDTITFASDSEVDPYTAPPSAEHPARFDPNGSTEIEVRRSPDGWLFVHPLVDDRDVGWFLFDTCGSAMAITRKAAKELGLPSFGKGYGVGGGGPSEFCFRPGKSFQLGPVKLDDPVFVELDMGFLHAGPNRPVAGICGYDLLACVVAEIDVTGPGVALYDPQEYKLPAGHWVKSVNQFGNLQVEASFEGDHKAMFRVDTGNPHTVIMHTPTVDRLHMLENRKTGAVVGTGIGGSDPMRQGKLDWFELAGHRFEDPGVIFATTKRGALATPWLAGTIGQQFLRPFLLVVDYSTQRVAFIPRGESKERRPEQRPGGQMK